jgi:hypothetical protein
MDFLEMQYLSYYKTTAGILQSKVSGGSDTRFTMVLLTNSGDSF